MIILHFGENPHWVDPNLSALLNPDKNKRVLQTSCNVDTRSLIHQLINCNTSTHCKDAALQIFFPFIPQWHQIVDLFILLNIEGFILRFSFRLNFSLASDIYLRNETIRKTVTNKSDERRLPSLPKIQSLKHVTQIAQ